MARFNRNRTLLEAELFRGSDGKNYLKSPAMEHLFSEYPKLSSVFGSTSDRKALFSALREHTDSSGDISCGGFLEAMGDLYEAGRVKRYQLDGTVLKEVFRDGMPGAEDRKFGIYGRGEGFSDAGEGGESEAEMPVSDSEGTEGTDAEAAGKTERKKSGFFPF